MLEVRLIDANALFNDLKESARYAREWGEETQDEEIKIRAEQALGTFIECALRVKNAPTIEAELVRHGKWIEDISRGSYSIYCSYCGSHKETICPSDYCPNCGAEMDLHTLTEAQLDETNSMMMGGADNS